MSFSKTRLIIVPCHSIWKHEFKTEGKLNLGQLQEHWYLAPFQYEGNDHLAFIEHSISSILLMLQDAKNESIVIFSGSQTKAEAGCMSEAQSYYLLTYKLIEEFGNNAQALAQLFDARIISCLKKINGILLEKNRSLNELFSTNVITEEFALDSFENLLFSIYRFKEFVDEYPQKVVIVGFGFKKSRFIDYHAKSIDFPTDCIDYVAIDPTPPEYTPNQLVQYNEELNLLEKRNALQYFESDWYGRRDPLRSKKIGRNPFKRFPGYQSVQLFDLCLETENDNEFFENYVKGGMPWSSSNQGYTKMFI